MMLSLNLQAAGLMGSWKVMKGVTLAIIPNI